MTPVSACIFRLVASSNLSAGPPAEEADDPAEIGRGACVAAPESASLSIRKEVDTAVGGVEEAVVGEYDDECCIVRGLVYRECSGSEFADEPSGSRAG